MRDALKNIDIGKSASVTDADGTARRYSEDFSDMSGGGFVDALTQKLGSQQAASEALRKAGIPGLKYFDQGSRVGGKGTRNYVTWDQDVLDRTEVVGVNEVPVNQIAVNLSAATGSIQGLQDLQDAANTGDIEAQQVLQDVASDSLAYLLSGVPGVRILSTPAQGLYFGDLEPSIGLDIGFVDGKSLTGTLPLKAQNNKDAILAALAKFADNFNQEQIDGLLTRLNSGVNIEEFTDEEQEFLQN